MKFCLAKYGYSREQQNHFLKLISSFLTFVSQSTYLTKLRYIDFTLTKRCELGKILIYTFHKSNLTDWVRRENRKLKKDGWITEYESRIFLNVIQPLSRMYNFLNALDSRSTPEKHCVAGLLEHFKTQATVDYLLK